MNSMPHKTISSMLQLKDITTSIAWTFTHLLSGTFKRNRPAFAHHDYPILAPLPDRKTQTRPQNNAHAKGPFIYFVTDDRGRVCYVGKSEEEHILRRWIRPGRGGPTSHYWTHSTAAGGCVFEIARGLREGLGPFRLSFVTLSDLSEQHPGLVESSAGITLKAQLAKAEAILIRQLHPLWNR
jgi:hypothetical protein